jgi:hypothetical protein
MADKPRYAVIQTTKAIYDQIRLGAVQMPLGIVVDACVASIDRDSAMIRFTGSGLPQAYEIDEGAIYGTAAFEIREGHPPELVLLFAVEEKPK